MSEWYRLVQTIVEEVDACIKKCNDEIVTLSSLSQKLGYSEFYISRKFKEISGMHFRDYLRQRTLAFALKEVRDSSKGLLQIAFDHGFSSHEAFSRSFKEAYGITPSEYRSNPVPVVLRTIIKPFDCYLISIGGTSVETTANDVKIYFVTIPAHKYLHIRNYEGNGYSTTVHLVIALTLRRGGCSIFIMIRNGFGNISDQLKSFDFIVNLFGAVIPKSVNILQKHDCYSTE